MSIHETEYDIVVGGLTQHVNILGRRAYLLEEDLKQERKKCGQAFDLNNSLKKENADLRAEILTLMKSSIQPPTIEAVDVFAGEQFKTKPEEKGE